MEHCSRSWVGIISEKGNSVTFHYNPRTVPGVLLEAGKNLAWLESELKGAGFKRVRDQKNTFTRSVGKRERMKVMSDIGRIAHGYSAEDVEIPDMGDIGQLLGKFFGGGGGGVIIE